MTLTSLLLNEVRDETRSLLDTILTHAAVGTGDNAPSAAQTSLQTEVHRNPRVSVDKTSPNIIVSSLEITSTQANSNTIREAGWFNAASAGTMWQRNLVNPINKTSDVQLFLDTQFTITITQG